MRERGRQRRRAARQLLHLTRYGGRGLVAGTLFAHVVAGLLPVTFLVGIGVALQRLATDTRWSAGLPWLAAALTAFVAQQLLAPAQMLLSQTIARRVDSYCITRFTSYALTRAPLRTLERPDVADRLSQADEAFEQWSLTPGAATEGALALTARYTQLVAAVVTVAVVIGPGAALAAALVALVARRGHSEAFYRWGQLIRGFQPLRRRMGYLRDLATSTRAAKEIRTLGLVDWVDERYRAESRAYLDPLWSWRRRVYGVPFLAYSAIALVGSVAALLLVAGGAGEGGRAAVGHVAIGVQAVVLCVRFGQMFMESDVKMVYGRSAWEALLEFEQICAEADARDGADPAPVVVVPRPEQRIACEDVTFGYDAERPVLRGLDLELPVGSSTALVGVNGAGKTTLVKLLTGLYTPSSGAVTVDGNDLRGIDVDVWQRAFAVTFQDFVRYEASLRDNVAMSAIAHHDDDAGITAELRRVGLGDLLDELPDGLDTPLTRSLPGGRDLSGGQWQRVALARALFAVRHGASVLVLDEPTAQLDARGEADFYDTFLDLTRGVTSLVISHRFSSVRRADRVVVLDGGRVTEAGTHDELVARGGTYAEMFAVQARRFADEDGAALTGAGETA
jgi:ATP-binding cassette subfamily B protein